MQKTILIIITIMLLPTVSAIYGGETFTYHFPYCDELKVNITGELPIDEGEYTILNDCTEIENNYYICNCSNDYHFNVSFKINTLNNYTLDFNYDYSKEAETQTRSRSGSSSSGSHSWVCEDWSDCINNETKRVCRLNNANYTQYKGCVSPEEENEKESNGKSNSESREEPEQEMQTSPEITTNQGQKTQDIDEQEPPTSVLNRITGAVTGVGEGAKTIPGIFIILSIIFLSLFLYLRKKK
jgi:hypothetical protein